MRTGLSLVLAASIGFAGGLFAPTVTHITSVSSLPATCNPGGAEGGAPADHVDLWNGSANQPYYCDSSNHWTAFGSATINLSSPPPIGNTTPNTGAFTTLNATTGTFGSGGGGQGVGSGTSSNTDFNGTLTQSSGTSSYTFAGTYSSHPVCLASDETSIASVKVTYTGTTAVTFTTSGASDVIDYSCTYRN